MWFIVSPWKLTAKLNRVGWGVGKSPGLRLWHAICNVFALAVNLFTGCQRQWSLIKKNTVINLIKAGNSGKSTQASHSINWPLKATKH